MASFLSHQTPVFISPVRSPPITLLLYDILYFSLQSLSAPYQASRPDPQCCCCSSQSVTPQGTSSHRADCQSRLDWRRKRLVGGEVQSCCGDEVSIDRQKVQLAVMVEDRDSAVW